MLRYLSSRTATGIGNRVVQSNCVSRHPPAVRVALAAPEAAAEAAAAAFVAATCIGRTHGAGGMGLAIHSSTAAQQAMPQDALHAARSAKSVCMHIYQGNHTWPGV